MAVACGWFGVRRQKKANKEGRTMGSGWEGGILDGDAGGREGRNVQYGEKRERENGNDNGGDNGGQEVRKEGGRS